MNDEVIQEYKRHIDRTLIRRSLKMTPEDRAQRLEQMAAIREELRQGLQKARKERKEAR